MTMIHRILYKKVLIYSLNVFSIEKGEAKPVEADSLAKQLLESNKCYILDCGIEVFLWVGKSTSLKERKSLSSTVNVNLTALAIQVFHCLIFMFCNSMLFFHSIGITAKVK